MSSSKPRCLGSRLPSPATPEARRSACPLLGPRGLTAPYSFTRPRLRVHSSPAGVRPLLEGSHPGWEGTDSQARECQVDGTHPVPKSFQKVAPSCSFSCYCGSSGWPLARTARKRSRVVRGLGAPKSASARREGGEGGRVGWEEGGRNCWFVVSFSNQFIILSLQTIYISIKSPMPLSYPQGRPSCL